MKANKTFLGVKDMANAIQRAKEKQDELFKDIILIRGIMIALEENEGTSQRNLNIIIESLLGVMDELKRQTRHIEIVVQSAKKLIEDSRDSRVRG